MARCPCTLNNFLREALRGWVIAALVLAYGIFGSISNSSTVAHHAACGEDFHHHHHHHHYGHQMEVLVTSLLRFLSDGFLGLVVATSLLAYGICRYFLGSMVVMVNGRDSSIPEAPGKSPPPQLVRVGSASSFHSTLATISEEQEEEKTKLAAPPTLLRKNKMMHFALARNNPSLSSKSSFQRASQAFKSD
jgi:hypothetical protein